MSGSARSRPDPSAEERRHRTTVILTLAGLAIAAISLVIAVIARQPDDPVTSRAHHIEKCNAKHRAPRTGTTKVDTKTSIRRSVFRRCTWPAGPHVAHDGYFEIRRTEWEIPNASLSGEFTQVSSFEGPCDTFRIQYRFSNQGTVEVEKPITVSTGQIVRFSDGRAINPSEVEHSPVEGVPDDSLLVFEHGRYELWRIACLTMTEGG